jgi:hypothetical protein
VPEPLRNRTLSKTGAVEAASKHLGGDSSRILVVTFLKENVPFLSYWPDPVSPRILGIQTKFPMPWFKLNRHSSHEDSILQ